MHAQHTVSTVSLGFREPRKITLSFGLSKLCLLHVLCKPMLTSLVFSELFAPRGGKAKQNAGRLHLAVRQAIPKGLPMQAKY